MPIYRFPADEIEIRGAVGALRSDDGVTPLRIADRARHQMPTDLMRFDVSASAGVRLAFDTAATRIHLDAVFARLEIAWSGPVETSIEVVVDGVLTASRPIDIGPIVFLDHDEKTMEQPGDASRVQFSDLPPGDKHVEIWLPHAARTTLLALEADAEVFAPQPDLRPRWVHHGSSISHCMETSSPTSTWPAVAARELGAASTNLGFAGEAMFDPFVAKTIRDLPAELISFKMGVNIVGAQTLSPRAFRTAAHGFLDTIREHHAETPIIVVSAIHCPLLENDDDVKALDLARTREILNDVVGSRADDRFLYYLDGRRLLGAEESGLLPDGLHPGTEGYRRIGERFAACASGLVTLA